MYRNNKSKTSSTMLPATPKMSSPPTTTNQIVPTMIVKPVVQSSQIEQQQQENKSANVPIENNNKTVTQQQTKTTKPIQNHQQQQQQSSNHLSTPISSKRRSPRSFSTDIRNKHRSASKQKQQHHEGLGTPDFSSPPTTPFAKKLVSESIRKTKLAELKQSKYQENPAKMLPDTPEFSSPPTTTNLLKPEDLETLQQHYTLLKSAKRNANPAERIIRSQALTPETQNDMPSVLFNQTNNEQTIDFKTGTFHYIPSTVKKNTTTVKKQQQFIPNHLMNNNGNTQQHQQPQPQPLFDLDFETQPTATMSLHDTINNQLSLLEQLDQSPEFPSPPVTTEIILVDEKNEFLFRNNAITKMRQIPDEFEHNDPLTLTATKLKQRQKMRPEIEDLLGQTPTLDSPPATVKLIRNVPAMDLLTATPMNSNTTEKKEITFETNDGNLTPIAQTTSTNHHSDYFMPKNLEDQLFQSAFKKPWEKQQTQQTQQTQKEKQREKENEVTSKMMIKQNSDTLIQFTPVLTHKTKSAMKSTTKSASKKVFINESENTTNSFRIFGLESPFLK